MSPSNRSWRPLFIFQSLFACLFVLSACQPGISEFDAGPELQASPSAIISAVLTLQVTPTSDEINFAPRSEIVEYLVKEGDSLSSIAASFSISPQTLLWVNADHLFDNPDWLLLGTILTILPADGITHQVGGSDNLNNLASFFNTDAQLIIDWASNQIDPQNPQIFIGQWLFIPNGIRLSRWREMPDIPRNLADIDPIEFGIGACPETYSDGATSDGTFNAPILPLSIAGEVFSAWHAGIDIAVSSGEQVRAAASGLVVFAGWSNLGYGNMIIMDHGNADYSLYSGLGSVIATCGQSLKQGDLIARAAITGYPAGPILHFEIRRDGNQVDPLSLIVSP